MKKVSLLLFIMLSVVLISANAVFSEQKAASFEIIKVSRKDLQFNKQGKLHELPGDQRVDKFYLETELPEEDRGEAFTIQWKASQLTQGDTDVTVSFDFRRTGSVTLDTVSQSSTVSRPGRYTTEFKNIGADYFSKGKIATWKVTIIHNNEIITEKTSAQWSDVN